MIFGISEIYKIDSCGIYAIEGDKSTKDAIEVMRGFGVHLENHIAKKITSVDLNDFDIIICMTNQQKNNILMLYPDLFSKVFIFKEYIDENVQYRDIDDPWGLNINIYKACAKEIAENVDKLLEKF